MSRSKKRRWINHKLPRSRQKQLKKASKPLVIAVVGVLIGIAGTRLVQSLSQPANIVWAADDTVQVPRDLRKFLLDYDNECEAYKGKDSPDGVGLWGVYQVSKDQYAKIAYGCSWALSNYIMAVKASGEWQLIQPAVYFAPFKDGIDPTKGALPYCSVVQEYKIPGEIESFCIMPDGTAKPNEL